METEIKDIFAIVASTLAILGFAGALIAGVVLWWGRKWWEPLGAKEDLAEKMNKSLHAVREDFHSSLARMEASATERHEVLSDNLSRIDRDVRRALDLAQEAKDEAVEAKHDAEMAKLKGGKS